MAWKIWAFIKFIFYSSICFFEEDQYIQILKEQALTNVLFGIAYTDKSKSSKGFTELNRLLKQKQE